MTKLLTLLFISMFLMLSCVQQDHDRNQKKIIHTEKAPGAIGVYSQAIQVGNTLYLAGQIGLNPETSELIGDDLRSQTHQTLQNIEAVLEAAGFSMSDVVKAQVFLKNMDDYADFNEVYIQYFSDNPPARAVVEVSRIPLDAKIEIMMEAVK